MKMKGKIIMSDSLTNHYKNGTVKMFCVMLGDIKCKPTWW